jgi:hypothetical protein
MTSTALRGACSAYAARRFIAAGLDVVRVVRV